MPKKLVAVTSLLKVFAPAIVCTSVDINPGLLALAAANVNVLPLIVPPVVEVLVFEYANVVTPTVELTVPAAVILPFASTVKVGIAVVDP